MKVYLFDGSNTLGPFDEAGARETWIQNGRLPTMMACLAGDSEWRKITDVLPLVREDNPGSASKKTGARKVDLRGFADGVIHHISAAAGVERLDHRESKGMFSAIWQKRTDDEIEAYFSVGTPETTPDLEQIDTRWPKPWAFFKAFLGCLLAFVGLYYVVAHFGNSNGIPAVLMTGALAVPCSVLILFFEFNAPKNISLYQLLRLTSFGGVIALITSLFLFGWASGLGLDWMGASVAGLVEEPGKLLAMLIVVNKVRYRWTLNGLLIGACVGTGFAVVETAGYAFSGLLSDMQIGGAQTETTLLLRALLYPLGGHALLSAIVGAALWRTKGQKPFEWSMLKDSKFLRLLAVSVVLHALWNSPLDLPLFGKQLCIGFVAWLIILSLVQSGLKEIRESQSVIPRPTTMA